MAVETINGCLFKALDNGEIDVIAHCVNCVPRMSSGIAGLIRDRYPDDYAFYINHTRLLLDSGHDPLGKICHLNKIVNLYGQRLDFTEYCKKRFATCPEGGELVLKRPRLVDYYGLSKALLKLRDLSIRKNITIGIPFNLGCGEAGGQWWIVSKLIAIAFSSRLAKIKIYKLED